MKKRILNALYLSVLSAILAAAVLAVKQETSTSLMTNFLTGSVFPII